MIILASANAVMVGKLVRLLASDKEGEVIGAARALGRILHSNGLSFHELADAINVRPQPVAWRDTVRFCRRHWDELNDRERAFITSLTRWRGELTAKQERWLDDICERIREAAA